MDGAHGDIAWSILGTQLLVPGNDGVRAGADGFIMIFQAAKLSACRRGFERITSLRCLAGFISLCSRQIVGEKGPGF